MGCQDKIEDQESLNVFIQSLYDSERLNVSYSKEAYARITDFFSDETNENIVSNSYTKGYDITSI